MIVTFRRLSRPATTLAAAALLLAGTMFTGAEARTVVEDSIDTEAGAIRLVRITGDIEEPWSIAVLPGGDMLVTDKPGTLYRVSPDGTLNEVSGVPTVEATGQGGLLDVVLDPEFGENSRIYLTYSKPEDGDTGNTATALARGTLDGTTLRDVSDIFVQNIYSDPGRHYGSRIAFTPDGKILVSVGDRGTIPLRAQDLREHAGSVLRLNRDGSVPDDNPFVGLQDAAEEIHSYGHRNIQGMVVDPATGTIWASEHGPRGGDELNHAEAGLNYGWPVISHGGHYNDGRPFGITTEKEGMEQPVREWTPSPAFSGLAMVTGDRFPGWSGNLLLGALRGERIIRVVLEGDAVAHEEDLLHETIGRIRDVREGPDGYIYVLSEDGSKHGVYRIEPAD